MENATLSIDRRGFLATAASGLTLSFALDLGGLGPRAEAAPLGTPVNSWLTVATDNTITLTVGSSDMGQGSFQGLGQVMAEDLMVDPARIRLEQGGPTLAVPAPVGTAIVTAGSGVTRGNFWKLRDAAAIARETLVMAAMARIGDTARGNFSVVDGVVVHAPSGQRLSYGALAADAARLTPPASAPLVPDSQFKSIGKPMARQDIPPKVDGSAKYGLDVRLPGMVFAAVRHCPTFGGTLSVVPATPGGAIAVVPLVVQAGHGRGATKAGTTNAFAVVAATTWDAMQGAQRAAPAWQLPANAASLNTAQFLADGVALQSGGTPYVSGAANGPGTVYTVEATPTDARATLTVAGTTLVEANYTLPYASHGCMEVLNCTVDYVPGVKCDVYAPTQVARSALALVVQMTGLPADKVSVRTTLLGGGLGRKAELDFIAQAVQVGMAVARPVMLVWRREEDFTQDQYRPMAVVRARAAVDPNGQIAAWVYRNVSPSILAQRGVPLGARGDSQGYEASNDLPYAMNSRLVEWVSHPSPIPVGFWRSVGASINTFAVESFIDELARTAKQDPYAFRRARLTDPRWTAVLDTAAAMAGWSTKPPTGRARGIAIGKAFNTIVALVAEVSGPSATSFAVQRVWVAVDAYLTVNPTNVEAQIVGGVVHGLNAALYGQQTFSNGAAERKNFNTNPMIRISRMPQVLVKLMPAPAVLDRNVAIGGIGELGVPTLAPAVANAVAALTGTRVRSLPFFPNATSGA